MTMEQESPNSTEVRLLSVVAAATLRILPADFAWLPLALDRAPSSEAIACVRDGSNWFELTRATIQPRHERYFVVSFHFSESIPANGFVGWLATYLRQTANTGVVVICGKDQRQSPGILAAANGVFDYWCCMIDAKPRFLSAIEELVNKGKMLTSLTQTPNLSANTDAAQ